MNACIIIIIIIIHINLSDVIKWFIKRMGAEQFPH